MPNTALAKIPYPSGSDAPAAAADMMAIVQALDAKLVLPAVDEADRNARYAEAPVSTLVVSGESKRVWLKTGSGPTDWHTIYYDTGWVSEGFVVQDGWSLNKIGGRTHGPTTEIRGELVRTGDDLTATNTGHLPDQTLVSVPPQYRPESDELSVLGVARSQRTSGTIELHPSGNVNLLDLHANSTIDNGGVLRFSVTFLGV